MSSSVAPNNLQLAAPPSTLEQAPVEDGLEHLELSPTPDTLSGDTVSASDITENVSIRPATLEDVAELYTRYGQLLLRYAIRKAGPDNGPDIFHTAATKICSRLLEGWKPPVDALQKEFYLSMTRLVIDRSRVKASTELPISAVLTTNQDNEVRDEDKMSLSFLTDHQNVADEAILHVDTESAFGQMSTVLADTLHYYIDGYSADEIGAMLGIAPNTIQKRLNRAREEFVQGMPGYNMDLKRRPSRAKRPTDKN